MKKVFHHALVLQVFIAVYILISANIIQAESRTPQPFSFKYCENEKKLFCNEKKTFSDIGECLITHYSKLTTECKQEIERFRQFKEQGVSRGAGALSAFGGLNAIGPPVPLVSYSLRYSPENNSSPSFTENKADIAAPLFNTPKDTFALSLAGGDLHLGDNVTLDSGTQVPKDLYRIELGTQYFHKLSHGKNWSLKTSIGYAGDKPFASTEDITYSLNANYGFPGAKNGFWIVSVFFSNNNPLLNYVPIPGVGYLYKTPTFTGLFGFPATALNWTPIFPWSFSFGFFGPNVQSEIAYGSLERLQFFAGYYWTTQSYIPNQRTNDLYRLTIEEMKTGVGLRTLLGIQTILGELQIGRSFDREVYIGQGIFNHDGGSSQLGDAWYMALNIKAKF